MFKVNRVLLLDKKYVHKLIVEEDLVEYHRKENLNTVKIVT